MKKLLLTALAPLLLLTAINSYADGAFKITAATPLPSQGVLIGQQYTVKYTLQNILPTGAPTLTPKIHAAAGTPFPADLTVNSDTCTGRPIAPQAFCTWSATLHPVIPGAKVVDLQIDVGPNLNVPLTETQATAYYPQVEAKVSKQLPEQSLVGNEYNVLVSFKNTSIGDLDKIDLTTVLPEGMKTTTDNCTKAVKRGASCTWAGTFVPGIPGAFSFQLAYSSNGVQHSIKTEQTKAKENGFEATILNAWPEKVFIGTQYPIEYKLTNRENHAVTVDAITSNNPAGFVPFATGTTAGDTDTCTGKTLAANTSCYWGGNLTAANPVVYQLSPQLKLDGAVGTELLPVANTTGKQATFNSSIKAGTALPGNTVIGTPYTTTYTLTNPANTVPLKIVQLTGFTTNINIAPGGTCSIGYTLAPGSSCTFNFNFDASEGTLYTIRPAVEVQVEDGQTSIQSMPQQVTRGIVADVAVDRTSDALPTKTTLNKAYALAYTITNHSAVSQHLYNIAGMPSSGFVISNDGCSDQDLAVDASCNITATYTPASIGSHEIALNMQLSNGQFIYFPTEQTDTENSLLSITYTHKLPAKLKVGEAYPNALGFKLTNSSGVAQTISAIDLTPAVSGFTWATNTCATTLANGASCELLGNYTPQAAGVVSINPSVAFQGGASQALGDYPTEAVTNDNIAVTSEYPLNRYIKQLQPFVVAYQFTNQTSGAIGNLRITGIPSTFQIVDQSGQPGHITNGCSGTIAVGDSCIVNMYLMPTTATPIGILNFALTGTFSTTGSASITVQTPAHQFTVERSGKVDHYMVQTIPTSMSYLTTKSYKTIIEFENNTGHTVSLTNVNHSTNFSILNEDKSGCANIPDHGACQYSMTLRGSSSYQKQQVLDLSFVFSGVANPIQIIQTTNVHQ